MRKPLVAGNWKMNLDGREAGQLAAAVARQAMEYPKIDIALCPPSVYLTTVASELENSAVALGGQDMYFEKAGAFTGEISGPMLIDVGCRYVILGHSERRHILGESDELINRKVHAALAVGLIPILCVGELLEEREAGETDAVVRGQLTGSLHGISAQQMASTVIAYEPVWAIGTGKIATPEQAQTVHADLRRMVQDCYNAETAAAIRIQYGGSVKPSNAADLLSQPDVDGALVGGASLKAEDFLGILAVVG
jgi:triosephosphate isomerase